MPGTKTLSVKQSVAGMAVALIWRSGQHCNGQSTQPSDLAMRLPWGLESISRSLSRADSIEPITLEGKKKITTWRSQEGTEPQEVMALSRGVPEAAISPAHSPSQLCEVGS